MQARAVKVNIRCPKYSIPVCFEIGSRGIIMGKFKFEVTDVASRPICSSIKSVLVVEG